MKIAPPHIIHRTLFVLHVALSDLRYLAKAGKNQQAYELGDTLENIPGFLVDWEDGHLDKIKNQLEAYSAKYGKEGLCEYAKYLDKKLPPERF
jgi:hypothetical protein